MSEPYEAEVIVGARVFSLWVAALEQADVVGYSGPNASAVAWEALGQACCYPVEIWAPAPADVVDALTWLPSVLAVAQRQAAHDPRKLAVANARLLAFVRAARGFSLSNTSVDPKTLEVFCVSTEPSGNGSFTTFRGMGWYSLLTESIGPPPDDPFSLSLAELLATARRISQPRSDADFKASLEREGHEELERFGAVIAELDAQLR